MHSQKRHIKLFLTLVFLAVTTLFSSCSRPVYYSSTRVYNARKAQNKRLKSRGYSNQQYGKSNKKNKKRAKKNNFKKRKYKSSSSNKRGRK